MAFVGFSRQCEHKTAFNLPSCRDFCSVPIRVEAVCTIASARGQVSKLPTTIEKSSDKRWNAWLFMHMSLPRVLCLWQGKEEKRQFLPLLSGRYSAGQITAPKPGWFCALRALQRAAHQQPCPGKRKREFGQGSLCRELWPHLCFTVKIVGGEQGPEHAADQKRVRTARLCTATKRQVELGDGIPSGQQEFSKALDPDSLCYTTFNTTGDKISPPLHRWATCNTGDAGVVFSAHRRAGGGWNGMELCSVISSLVFPPFVF